MTSYFQNIRSLLLTRVHDNFSAVPIAYPGVKHIPTPSEPAHLNIDVHFANQVQAELNGSKRIDGFIAATFFGREGGGTDLLESYRDQLSDLFPMGLSLIETVSARPVRFRAMVPKPPVPVNEGWVGIPAVCPFYFFTT